MKTERRHELQTNTLADWLGRQIEALRPHFTTIITGIVVLVVALVGYGIWSSRSQQAAAEAWTNYFSVSFAENSYARNKFEVLQKQAQDEYRDELRTEKNDPSYELTDGEKRLVDEKVFPKVRQAMLDETAGLARQYERTKLGLLANMEAGDLSLSGAIDSLFPNIGQSRDLKQAATYLDDAVAFYERALQQAKGDVLMERRVRYGLARAYETRSTLDPENKGKEDLERAVAQYEQISTGDDVFASAARAQLKLLEKPENLYSWFGSMLTRPISPHGPGGLSPGNLFERFHPSGPGGGSDSPFNFDDATDPLPPGFGAPSSN